MARLRGFDLGGFLQVHSSALALEVPAIVRSGFQFQPPSPLHHNQSAQLQFLVSFSQQNFSARTADAKQPLYTLLPASELKES
uniref:Uncharacterized protein n=1 Tax=Arundo donax TaxID=35708 RepID=A0A0A8Y504_ARUDO